jgi:competence protein ComEA
VDLTPAQKVGVALAIACILVATGIGVWQRVHRGPGVVEPQYTPAPQPSLPASIAVHVAGAVARPGVYQVPRGARVQEAIAAAGGLLATADESAINLAAPLDDGQKVEVRFWTIPPATPRAPTDPAPGPPPQPLNINTATSEQLQAVPGIGPELAGRIVAYRQRTGGFGSLEEVGQVEGIGPRRLAQIAPHIRIR